MKPNDYVIIMKDDVKELENEINERLKDGWMFLGELQRFELDNLWVREMVKLDKPVINVSKPEVKEDGDK